MLFILLRVVWKFAFTSKWDQRICIKYTFLYDVIQYITCRQASGRQSCTARVYSYMHNTISSMNVLDKRVNARHRDDGTKRIMRSVQSNLNLFFFFFYRIYTNMFYPVCLKKRFISSFYTYNSDFTETSKSQRTEKNNNLTYPYLMRKTLRKKYVNDPNVFHCNPFIDLVYFYFFHLR